MRDHTKESPGCYHSMIIYLASLENTDYNKLIRINNQAELFIPSKGTRKRLRYASYKIRVIDKEGLSHPYIDKQMRYDNPKRGITADHFLINTMKGMSDFTTVVKSAGNYTDSLGNGWSQKVALYVINDQYFAMMDCACAP